MFAKHGRCTLMHTGMYSIHKHQSIYRVKY